MKTALQVVGLVIGFVVFRLALSIGQEWASGELATMWRSGAIGSGTLCFWAVTLLIGPVAAVQLWRLRQVGLFATGLLGALGLVDALVRLLLYRTPDTTVEPLLLEVVLSSALLALVGSPAARRACVAPTKIQQPGSAVARESHR